MILQNKENKESLIYKKMMNRQTPLVGNQLDAYIKNKRATTGQLYTWSDSLIFEAMAEMLSRPIMQLTYPVYINGEKKTEIGPKFMLSACGNRTKLPIFVHYNGINHYNVFVPKAWPAATTKPVTKQSGMGGMAGMFAGLEDDLLPKQQSTNKV